MASLGSELLRPVSRTQIRRWLFSQLLVQFAGVFSVAAIIVIGVTVYRSATLGPRQIIALNLAGLAGCCLFYGLCVWIILIRRIWVIAIAFVLAFVTAEAIGLVIVLGYGVGDKQIPTTPLMAAAGALFALAMLAIGTAWRRWNHLEPGEF